MRRSWYLPICFLLCAGCPCVPGETVVAQPPQRAPDSPHRRTANRAQVATRSANEEAVKRATVRYWNAARQIYRDCNQKIREISFPYFLGKEEAKIRRQAANRLRALDKTHVDPVVIDHVNEVIRGFETVADIVEESAKRALLQDAIALLGWLVRTVRLQQRLAVYPRVWPGFSKEARQTIDKATEKIQRITRKWQKTEASAIRHVRQKYGVELDPW